MEACCVQYALFTFTRSRRCGFFLNCQSKLFQRECFLCVCVQSLILSFNAHSFFVELFVLKSNYFVAIYIYLDNFDRIHCAHKIPFTCRFYLHTRLMWIKKAHTRSELIRCNGNHKSPAQRNFKMYMFQLHSMAFKLTTLNISCKTYREKTIRNSISSFSSFTHIHTHARSAALV